MPAHPAELVFHRHLRSPKAPVIVALICLLIAPSCGRTARIVGGQPAAPLEFPYAVSLQRRGGHFCGATVVAPTWLLTAGHCLCNGVGRPMRPAQLEALVGTNRLAAAKFGEDNRLATVADGYRVAIERIWTHPNYSCSQTRADIGLLQLAQPLRLTEAVQIAALPEEQWPEDPPVELEATVCGWGWTREDQALGDRADRLLKAEVTVWQAPECQRMYADSGHPVRLAKGQMCAGHRSGGVDACWADSGGPLVAAGEGGEVIGVVSTGIGCARRGLSGIYTDVRVYLGWMRQVMDGGVGDGLS